MSAGRLVHIINGKKSLTVFKNRELLLEVCLFLKLNHSKIQVDLVVIYKRIILIEVLLGAVDAVELHLSIRLAEVLNYIIGKSLAIERKQNYLEVLL